MKNFISCFLLPIFFFNYSIARAGGVSDGGGGVVNSNPVDIAHVLFATAETGGILLAWLYREESTFKKLPTDEQKRSPSAKLFLGKTSAIDLIKTTAFEVRMNKPCYDSGGNSKDGSVLGARPGTLCISPYSMAPKLNESNYEQETAALVMHEISHVLGADENEATEIQKNVLFSLEKYRIIDFKVDTGLIAPKPLENRLGGEIDMALMNLRFWSKSAVYDPNLMKHGDAASIAKDLQSIDLQYLRKVAINIQLAPNDVMAQYQAQVLKIYLLEKYICANNPSSDSIEKEECKNDLAKIFANDDRVSVRQAELRMNNIDLGLDAELVTIQKWNNWVDVRSSIIESLQYFNAVINHAGFLHDFEIQIYKSE